MSDDELLHRACRLRKIVRVERGRGEECPLLAPFMLLWLISARQRICCACTSGLFSSGVLSRRFEDNPAIRVFTDPAMRFFMDPRFIVSPRFKERCRRGAS